MFCDWLEVVPLESRGAGIQVQGTWCQAMLSTPVLGSFHNRLVKAKKIGRFSVSTSERLPRTWLKPLYWDVYNQICVISKESPNERALIYNSGAKKSTRFGLEDKKESDLAYIPFSLLPSSQHHDVSDVFILGSSPRTKQWSLFIIFQILRFIGSLLNHLMGIRTRVKNSHYKCQYLWIPDALRFI